MRGNDQCLVVKKKTLNYFYIQTYAVFFYPKIGL